jgi:hypothetical protein
MSIEMLDGFMAITLLVIYTPLLTHRFSPEQTYRNRHPITQRPG